MLIDSAFIQESDTSRYNKKAIQQRLQTASPLYTEEDARKCMGLFITSEFNHKFYINDNIAVCFYTTGHMLGAACTYLEIKENGKITRIAYTGDIGRQHSYLLPTPENFPQCDYLITESTYGSRIHEPEEDAQNLLLQTVYNEHKLPSIKVFVDSPLAINATGVFLAHTEYLNDNVRRTMLYDDDPFSFNNVTYIRDVEKSKALNKYRKPCIIISASGMLEAGRVKHHVANNIMKPQNTILMVGYCSPTTLGARIQEKGLRHISIFGNQIAVRADIKSIEAFSGHGDYREMIKYLRCQDPDKIKNIFLVHGEYQTQLQYKQHLQESGFRNIIIPEVKDKYVLQEQEAVRI